MTNMKGKAQSPGTRTVKKLSVHGTKKREGSLLKKAINNSAAQPRETKDTRALQERREANRLSAEKSRQRKKNHFAKLEADCENMSELIGIINALPHFTFCCTSEGFITFLCKKLLQFCVIPQIRRKEKNNADGAAGEEGTTTSSISSMFITGTDEKLHLAQFLHPSSIQPLLNYIQQQPLSSALIQDAAGFKVKLHKIPEIYGRVRVGLNLQGYDVNNVLRDTKTVAKERAYAYNHAHAYDCTSAQISNQIDGDRGLSASSSSREVIASTASGQYIDDPRNSANTGGFHRSGGSSALFGSEHHMSTSSLIVQGSDWSDPEMAHASTPSEIQGRKYVCTLTLCNPQE